jgi:hypothetical protein
LRCYKEASAISVRAGHDVIEAEDVINGIDRVTNGLRHPVLDKTVPIVAMLTRHELGHAIVASVMFRHTGRGLHSSTSPLNLSRSGQ